MNFNFPIILASKSPRRQQLLKEMGVAFSVKTKDTEENYPSEMKPSEVPTYLASKKAHALLDETNNEIIIAADTIVLLDNEILGKPTNEQEAFDMLRKQSGKSHDVITGVCLLNKHKEICFSDTTKVHFKELSKEEIEFYITTFQPFDKAGSYGIQEWLGKIAINKIEGSYFNVMGLPTHKLYEALLSFNQ